MSYLQRFVPIILDADLLLFGHFHRAFFPERTPIGTVAAYNYYTYNVFQTYCPTCLGSGSSSSKFGRGGSSEREYRLGRQSGIRDCWLSALLWYKKRRIFAASRCGHNNGLGK
jgi:hypothetical protein